MSQLESLLKDMHGLVLNYNVMERLVRETYELAESIKGLGAEDFLAYRNSLACLVTNYILDHLESNKKPTVELFVVEKHTDLVNVGDVALFVQLNDRDENSYASYTFSPTGSFDMSHYQKFIDTSVKILNNLRQLGKIDTEKSKILLSLAFDFGSGKEIYSGNLSTYLGRSGHILN